MNYSLLQLLNKTHSLKSVKSIHSHLILNNLLISSDLILNKLLRLYSRFGAIEYACKLFDVIPQPNPFLWTSLIHGFVENFKYTEAFNAFTRMHSGSVEPLNFTIASVLKGLSREKRLKEGEEIYGFVFKKGFGSDLIVQNAVLDFSMRCGKVDFARSLFDEMKEKDVVSWNTMVSGYGNNGRVDIAREFFNEMTERNVVSWTSIINVYVKSGNMVEARVLFDRMPNKDLASWNVMVSGYVNAGDPFSARFIFEEMPIHGVETWNLMILGFCKLGKVELANDYFNRMPKRNVASWTIMVDGYIKSGNVDHARFLFDQMPEKNLVSWSTMISGYAKNGQPRNALDLYNCLKGQGIKPDETFILVIISACSQLGVIDTAQSVICDFVGPSLFSNLRVVTSLIDMYAKCGSIEKAVKVFEMVNEKDLLCYSTMITAFANHGLVQDAISLFAEMQRANIKPDGVAFLGVLTACNHGGLPKEGRLYFEQMKNEYGIQPSEKHYACFVDLLGRAGCLEEAHKLISNMPIAPHSVVWGALLAACRVHCNVQLAEVAASELFKIEPDNSGNYVLLSNIYAAAGVWDGVARVRTLVREHQVRKNRASSWIELGCIVHEFVMGDTSHFDSENIYFILDLLSQDMKLLGYIMDYKKTQVLPSNIHYNILEDG
ncbi:pentatricopeptide repeat-containing protein At4g02750-like [Mangifera indica]|uniref:pentatricopeptide repeat-containing protein At4g02750-like n=1 Tax=Mangifera indica TaxID=29780 RepID=UPI001CFA4D9C|nr:pentatricopeptide repeat-containing protein At4g02750-like [Mangifera indica]